MDPAGSAAVTSDPLSRDSGVQASDSRPLLHLQGVGLSLLGGPGGLPEPREHLLDGQKGK